MANEIKKSAPAKLSKKEIRHLVETKLLHSISEITHDKKFSKGLEKKVKKAGKMLSKEVQENLKTKPINAAVKPNQKTAKPKKAGIKKAAAKK
jgi:hypothetical protein